MIWVYVALGAVVGAWIRSIVAEIMSYTWSFRRLYASLLINLSGAWFLSEVITQVGVQGSGSFVKVTAFCGGYIAFSTFSYEVFFLWNRGHKIQCLCYILMSLYGATLMACIGHLVASPDT